MADRGVELKCADYQVTSDSIGHTRAGAVFRCTIRPVTDEVLESLHEAAGSNGLIRLVFPKSRWFSSASRSSGSNQAACGSPVGSFRHDGMVAQGFALTAARALEKGAATERPQNEESIGVSIRG